MHAKKKSDRIFFSVKKKIEKKIRDVTLDEKLEIHRNMNLERKQKKWPEKSRT